MGITGLAEIIKEKFGLSQSKSRKIVSALVAEIKSNVLAGDVVVLKGFGSFRLGVRHARTYRDPRNGSFIQKADRTVIKLKSLIKEG